MDRRTWFRWLLGASALAVLALLGVYIYDLGVAHGLAEGAKVTDLGSRGAPFIGWWRPWGFGFGFFPFFPFLLILLFVALLRRLFWRGPWYGRRWYGRPWSHGPDGVPPDFEEWHRRAHQEERPASGTKG